MRDLEGLNDRELVRVGVEAVTAGREADQKAVEYEMWRREHRTARRAAYDTLLIASAALVFAFGALVMAIPGHFSVQQKVLWLGLFLSLLVGTGSVMWWWLPRVFRER